MKPLLFIKTFNRGINNFQPKSLFKISALTFFNTRFGLHYCFSTALVLNLSFHQGKKT